VTLGIGVTGGFDETHAVKPPRSKARPSRW
jgi:hypothetical protein